MKHLIICREYPPAPSGGIGTYAFHIARLLAEAGETVHVIGQMWERADARVEEECHGRLIIHRVPYEDWASLLPHQPHPRLGSEEEKGLFKSSFPPQCFSWQASLIAEKLVEQEGIDIIEAQDFEAPLYYFQLRRALGKGPKRRPPCFVHLHSPTEFIARHNDWDLSLPAVLTAKRLEDYSIAAADALLCPSRYLARQAEAHYGLASGSIAVVPLPIGSNDTLERSEDTWKEGTICYAGRLERRKGVIEWIEAAVEVAAAYPAARFEFVGKNVLGTNRMSAEDVVEHLVPRDLRSRFLFRGEQPRSSLSKYLSHARMAVVPSRWENFPNTCVEAMCSGLPVLATRQGGMAEMIEDGRTGWLVDEANSDALRQALTRALDTPPARVAEMGRHASVDIRRMCDNSRIVESHLDFRNGFVKQGVGRSLQLPPNLLRFAGGAPERRRAQKGHYSGLGLVIVCRDRGRFADECLSSIERQTRKPAAVAIVHDELAEGHVIISQARRLGWLTVRQGNLQAATAKNAGIEAIASVASPLGYVFLDESDRLRPGFISECESTLEHCEEVGIVSCWTGDDKAAGDDRFRAVPCPAFPYQWVINEAAELSAVRAEALKEAGNFRPFMEDGFENWDLFNAVMAAGWIAVTIPARLAAQGHSESGATRSVHNHSVGWMRKSMLDRFPDLIALDARLLVLLVESRAAENLRNESHTLRKQIALARTAVKELNKAIMHVFDRIKKKAYRASARMLGIFKI